MQCLLLYDDGEACEWEAHEAKLMWGKERGFFLWLIQGADPTVKHGRMGKSSKYGEGEKGGPDEGLSDDNRGSRGVYEGDMGWIGV